MGDRDDLDLFARGRGGDRHAANIVVRRHDPALSAFFRYKVHAQEADDLKQKVWLELTRAWPFTVRSSFRAYLFGVACHVLYRHFAAKRREPDWDPRITSLAALDPPLSQRIARELGARDLRAVLARLALDVQVLLELRYVHEMSTDELAASYDVPVGTIKSRLHYARKQLAALMPADAQNLATP